MRGSKSHDSSIFSLQPVVCVVMAFVSECAEEVWRRSRLTPEGSVGGPPSHARCCQDLYLRPGGGKFW